MKRCFFFLSLALCMSLWPAGSVFARNQAESSSSQEEAAPLEGQGEGNLPDESAVHEKIRILLIPKFELGEITGDAPGEAQFYYDEYLKGGKEYELPYMQEGNSLYVKDGIAMFLTGEGKLATSLGTLTVLTDGRFDFSDAYIISVGCLGSASRDTVMGDVFIITSTIDYDLGHHADIREMTTDRPTWYHDNTLDSSAYVYLNRELAEQVYELVKDTRLETTEKTRKYMLDAFDQEEWAGRDPIVMMGTSATGDNYWKGIYDEENARLMTETYGCPDPYIGSDMEDHAIAFLLDRMGMLERFIIIRASVNLDIFANGSNPDVLWDADSETTTTETETGDIFPVAMENNFKVGKQVISAILDGTLS